MLLLFVPLLLVVVATLGPALSINGFVPSASETPEQSESRILQQISASKYVLNPPRLCCFFALLLFPIKITCHRENKKPCFYIYEWPEEFDDLWPPAGANLSARSGYSHEFRDNYGAGTMLDNDAVSKLSSYIYR